MSQKDPIDQSSVGSNLSPEVVVTCWSHFS